MRFAKIAASLVAATMTWGATPNIQAEAVRITVENMGPPGSTFVTPVFLGLHDGSFNLRGTGTATPGLEALAELGMTGGLTSEFLAGAAGRQAGTVNAGIGPLAPGQSNFVDFVIGADSNQLTLASMVLPSSDFFLGNVQPGSAFDLSGFNGTPLTFTLASLYDAGTELNDFATSPGNPLLGLPPGDAGLSAPDTDSTIRLVDTSPGMNPFDGFLNAPAGGFDAPISQLRVTVTSVPEPSLTFFGCMMVGALGLRRRSKTKLDRNEKRALAG